MRHISYARISIPIFDAYLFCVSFAGFHIGLGLDRAGLALGLGLGTADLGLGLGLEGAGLGFGLGFVTAGLDYNTEDNPLYMYVF